MINKKYKVQGMHCTSCALAIESDLEDIGVMSKCNFAKEELDVAYDSSKINEEKIVKIIETLGYKVHLQN